MKLIIAAAALAGMLVSGCAPRETFQGAGADAGASQGQGHGSSFGSTGVSPASPSPRQNPEAKAQAQPEEPGLGPTDLGPFEDSPGAPDFILPRNRTASLEI